MKSTGRPLVVAFAGAVLALVAGIAAVSASLDASAAVPGQFPVGTNEGMPPGSVSALVFFGGLLLVGVGAAVHDGRQLRSVSPRPSARVAPRTTLQVAPRMTPQVAPRIAPQPSPQTSPDRAPRIESRVVPEPVAHGRRTSSGTRLVLVSAARRG